MAPQRTLYAYFEDGDLGEVAVDFQDLLRDFVAEHPWRGARPFVVSQRLDGPVAGLGAAGPTWDLGLHLPLPRRGSAPADWFEDVETLVGLCQRIYRESGRTFVIGVFVPGRGYAEDLCYIDGRSPDLDALREQALGEAEEGHHGDVD